MKKYHQLIINSLQEYFVYRLNFILWRVRVVVSILITYFLWSSVFAGNGQIFGYSQPKMLTYVLLTIFVNGVVLSTQTAKVAGEISYGRISNYLIRPIDYIKLSLVRDIADKIINTVFAIIEFFLLIFFLKPPVIFPSSLSNIPLFILFLVLAGLLYFEIGMILSFIGFWSHEIWAPRFIFFIVLAFLSGSYFPLDILPPKIYGILSLLPFSYLVFYPLKIFLGEIPVMMIYKGIFISFFWLIFLYFAMKFIWRKGIKIYTSEGQ